MATVSGKFRFTLIVTVLAAASVSGCSSVMPIKQQSQEQGNVVDTVTSRQNQVITPANVPLPRQTYDSAGKRVPYVAAPNPYTTNDAAVPQEAKSIFVVANGLLRAGNVTGAKSKFRMLTEKYPTLSGPWVRLGAIAEKNEEYDEAIEHYKKAISVNKNNVNAYIALALLQRRQGYFSDAHNTYLDALTVWKDFPEAHLDIAILYDLYLNRAEEAQKHYEAYYFLGGEKDEKVKKWLVEVKQRTGIEVSFIDIRPAGNKEEPGGESDAAIAAAKTNGSD